MNIVIIFISIQLTHLQPFPMWSIYSDSVSISPLLYTSPSSLHFQNHSLSPFNQNNNSLLSQSFPTASISPAMTSSEEDINIYTFGIIWTKVFL